MAETSVNATMRTVNARTKLLIICSVATKYVYIIRREHSMSIHGNLKLKLNILFDS